MLTTYEQAINLSRPKKIDYNHISDLYFLGNYKRELPVSIKRMMENAFDWEHLPYVHASSFCAIELVDSGKWGWRAKTKATKDRSDSFIELIVDESKYYWATSVLSGLGKGVEIHTQATPKSDTAIEIDVRFYLPKKPFFKFIRNKYLNILTEQYTLLYDEDFGLMHGRQSALDEKKQWQNIKTKDESVTVGIEKTLDRSKTYSFKMSNGRFCVRYWKNKWIVHSATCTHMLGPLDNAEIDGNGNIQCPWHAYSFNVETGSNVGTGSNTNGKCRSLDTPPLLEKKDGVIYLTYPFT